MRVMIFADEFFAIREQALLSRLEVGLADEGLRVVHALPEHASSYAPASVASVVLTYPERRWRWTHPATARGVSRSLAVLDESATPDRVDIVHAFGGSSWGLAAEFAAMHDAALVLEVWRTGLNERARAIGAKRPLTLFVAPDHTIAAPLRLGEPGGLHVREIPWGVHTPEECRPAPEAGRAISVMMVGAGRIFGSFAAAMEGIAQVIRRRPEVMVFCDAEAGRRAGLYPIAKRLGVLANVSFIADLEGRRDLVLQGDILIQPESRGEQRSVTLDAMAAGMMVLAAKDDGVSALRDGETARLIPSPTSLAWSTALEDLLAHPERWSALAASARRFTATHRRASDQIAGVIAAYLALRSKGSIPFPTGA